MVFITNIHKPNIAYLPNTIFGYEMQFFTINKTCVYCKMNVQMNRYDMFLSMFNLTFMLVRNRNKYPFN